MFKKTSNYSQGREPELLVGLDLGTSKVAVVVAEREADGDEAQIIGVGQAPSNGIRKGLIVNLDQAVRSVRQAVSDAQNMVGQDIRGVTVAFGGGEVTSIRSKGMVALGRSPRSVAQLDIERVIDAAQANVVVPMNQSILHTIPVEYSLDGNVGIDDPLGMNAMRLDIDVQSIIVPTATIQNVLNCVTRAGLEVNSLVLKPLVSALGVLTPEDALAGAVVIDFGGGTTGIAVFADGRPKHLALLPIGGDHLTNDLATVLKLPLNKAEDIKRTISLSGDFPEGETLDFENHGKAYRIAKSELHDIICCRLDELCDELIRPEIKNAKVTMLPGGVLLTGGVAKTEGIEDFFLEKLSLPARSALPLDANRMPPNRNTQEYASAAGIIKYILDRERDPFRYLDNPSIIKGDKSKPALPKPEPVFRLNTQPGKDKEETQRGDVFDSLKRVFKDIF
ncbi:MAG: cell division protein FtsA [Synergistes sp.]|nr:cell division protein FtsA [Synergistes sp.]MCR5336101.1 cell division protein FtsA [Synergistes sp.]